MTEGLAVFVAATGFLVVVMLVGWAVQNRLSAPAWSDVFWTFGVGVAGVCAALVALPHLPSPLGRRLAMAGLCGLWSLRLGLHIATRTARGGEDARYVQMREQEGPRFARAMLGFMLIQAPVGAILALAVFVAAHGPEPLGWRDAAAAAILALAIGGEALADAQLARFKADPANRRKVCDQGLWAISRHPNYLFEWLVWLAWPVAASTEAMRVLATLPAAAMMYLLLTRVSGVPPLERAMLASRGDAYRRYQARVPAFLPIAWHGARP